MASRSNWRRSGGTPQTGFSCAACSNGLDEGVALPSEPPTGAVDGITIISPFLSPDFVKKAGGWGKAGSRTLISSIPALTDMARRPGKPLDGFSKILAYTAPNVLVDEAPLALPGVEPASERMMRSRPPCSACQDFCFHSGEKTILRVGSANATERAWSGRNAEIMVELEAGEAFGSGLAVFGEDEQRIVGINNFKFDFKPKGKMIIFKNNDVPGVIANITSILAQANINIADFRLGRGANQFAMAVILVDSNIVTSWNCTSFFFILL